MSNVRIYIRHHTYSPLRLAIRHVCGLRLTLFLHHIPSSHFTFYHLMFLFFFIPDGVPEFCQQFHREDPWVEI